MIAGAILGLIGGAIPEIVKTIRDWSDKKHEIELLKLQMQYEQKTHEFKLEEIQTSADVAEAEAVYRYAEPKVTGNRILDGITNFLVSSVRPVITYAITSLYAYYKIVTQNYEWTEFDQELMMGIMFFWFSGRAFKWAFNKSR